MKKGIVLMLLVGLFISCHKAEPKEEIIIHTNAFFGKWQMVAALADPGNRSGVFIDVESDKILEFDNDSTVTSNGTICSISPDTDTPSSGFFDWDAQTITSGCTLRIFFFSDSTELALYFPATEPCAAKYKKL